ncbi:polyketide cyclase [Mixta theicola]|uniref:Polyketide cyclase n=1 Tax=Mixta theicola TaxID=1458355 RepID=A0A2K1Q7S4_9GAMM|nr:SRPBCC family protein [Mixta theicola]PNS11086.1 polyketide cyclase [Mixta theicola]GLR08433.1 hypothetical protein GCM10007905_11520 [Mixta theicola]
MSHNVKFIASYQVTTHATAETIWALWADVNNWDKWDSGINNAELHDEFKAGNKFSLTPQGGEPILVTLKTVTPQKEFSDETILPFGVLRNIHYIEEIGQQITVTHEVQAEISQEAYGFFSKEIWPHMQGGLPESVNNILSLAVKK